jgi:hypothetical protein
LIPVQRLVAVALLVAGVLVLAGPGWALLVAGGLLWVRDDRVTERVSDRWVRARAWSRVSWGRVRDAPRRVLAGGMMGVGAVAAPTGALVAAGVGAALLVAAAVLFGLSLLLGWGQ